MRSLDKMGNLIIGTSAKKKTNANIWLKKQ